MFKSSIKAVLQGFYRRRDRGLSFARIPLAVTAALAAILSLSLIAAACGGSADSGAGANNQQPAAPQSQASTANDNQIDLASLISDFDSKPDALNNYQGKTIKSSGIIWGYGGYPIDASTTTSSVMTITPTGAAGTAVDCIMENKNLKRIPRPGVQVSFTGIVDSFQPQGGTDKVQPQGKRIVVKCSEATLASN